MRRRGAIFPAMSVKKQLQAAYDRLAAHYGPTGWWPGDTAFEVALGAILTQNTAWTSVERAIANLKREHLLSPRGILGCAPKKLEELLKPSGYFRVKADRVRSFCAYLVTEHGGSMKRMARRPLEELRRDLLVVNGIGPETADDILLYACRKPVFVVDAYTRRILSRHGVVTPTIGYEELRRVFETHLDADIRLFKEFHGLLVWAGKDYCRKTPKCEQCPLKPLLRRGQPIL